MCGTEKYKHCNEKETRKMNINREYSSFEKIANLVLVLGPILQMYMMPIGGVGLVFSITLVLAVLNLYYGKNIVSNIPKWLNVYFVYAAFCYILSLSSYNIIPIWIIRTYLVYLMFYKWFNYDLFVKYYKFIALASVVFFFVQEVSYSITGTRIIGVLKFLPLGLTAYESAESYYETIETFSRSSSFFSEPALFAQFLFPLLSILLFKQKITRNSGFFIVAIILTLLLLKSGNALIGLLVVFVMLCIKIMMDNNVIRKIIVGVVFCILSCYVISHYVNSEWGNDLQARSGEIENNTSTISSGFMRIYRGYYVFDEYEPFEKILGIFNEQKIKEKIDDSIVASTFLKNDFYFNTFQHILLKTGYIGVIIMMMLFYSIWHKNDFAGKTIILIFVILLFISFHYFSVIMALYVVLASKLKQQKILQS